MGGTFDQRFRAYRDLAAARPSDFQNAPGGIEIALDPERAAAIERHVEGDYLRAGFPPSWAAVGIAYQDPYLRLLRDAVVFPSGREGVHHRVLSNNNPSGVAALPMLHGQIVLLRHFRHPTRQFHWEIPRGAVDPGRTPEEAIRAELREEMEIEVARLEFLGAIHGSNALISGCVNVYAASIEAYGRPSSDEGIVEIRPFDVATFERLVRTGEITDSFTLGAFLHARMRGLL